MSALVAVLRLPLRAEDKALQSKLRDYVQARIDLYRMPHDYPAAMS
jgi:hypothetical protein